MILSVVLITNSYAICANSIDIGANKITTTKDDFEENELVDKKYLDDKISETVVVPSGYGVRYYGGRAWLDRNLDAYTPTTATAHRYGGFFQWGRDFNGHQRYTPANRISVAKHYCNTKLRNAWNRTDIDRYVYFKATKSSKAKGNWVMRSAYCTGSNPELEYLWSSPGNSWENNGVCPTGWSVPSRQDFLSLNVENLQDGFEKIGLHATGYRAGWDGSVRTTTQGWYWTSESSSHEYSYRFHIRTDDSFFISDHHRASGYAIRCVKHLDK